MCGAARHSPRLLLFFLDRALAFLKSFVVSSRAAPPPIANDSASASPSSAAARLPSLLDYAVKAHVRPRDCVVVYSQHPRRIGHAHPAIQPPPFTRVSYVIEHAVRNHGVSLPTQQEVKESKTVSGLLDRQLQAAGGLAAAIVGEGSHWTAKCWCRSLCKLFKFLIDLVKRLRDRHHPALRTNKIGTGRTRLELIRQHLLTIMHHLLSPEKALLVHLCPDYARACRGRAAAEFCAAPHCFPGQPGLMDNFSRRYIHLWAWLTALGAAPYPPHHVAGDAGDRVKAPVEYDVRSWLKELAVAVGIDGSNDVLSYMMQDVWVPQLVPVCASACIPGVEEPMFYALPTALPLPPLAKTNKMRMLWWDIGSNVTVLAANTLQIH